MTVEKLVKECVKRLEIEPTAPVVRVVNAVCHYEHSEQRQLVLLTVRSMLGRKD